MKKSKIRRTIDRELLLSLFPSFIGTHLLDDILGFLIDTQIAVLLGRLTDAIFTRNVDYLKSNLLMIAVCLLFKIFGEPLIFAFFSSRSVFGSCKFSRQLLTHYLHKPYIEISENQAGDIPSRINHDIMDFVRRKLKQIADMILLPVFSLYMFFVLRQYNLMYAVIALASTAVAYVAPIVVKKRMAKFDSEERAYRSTMDSMETELASSSWCLKSMQIEHRLMIKMESLFTSFFHKIYLSKIRCSAVVNVICSICHIAAQMVIIIVGAFFIGTQKIGYGEIAAMLALISSITFLLDKITGLITVKPILNNLYERLLFFYSEAEHAPSKTEKVVLNNNDNIVEGNHVTAQYGDNTIFRNFSFNIPRNKITLLKGPNGCGKSTLVGMICGFEQPTSGELIINNESINNSISLSSQYSMLFRYIGLRDNIMLGCYERAIHEEAASVIEAFMGNNIENNIDVEELSGGEAQKAKLLRALLRDAEFLILDEPENHLDVEIIHKLVNEIKQMQKSVLIVSHSKFFDEIADHKITM